MWKQELAAFAVWTAVVGCCFVFNETPTRASEDGMTAAAQEPQPAPPPASPAAPSPIGIRPELSAAQQMQALDRHARFGMICYPGKFGPSDVPVIALDVKLKLE